MFSYADSGQFLISKTKFDSHQAASDFCAKQPGFTLTPETLPIQLWGIAGGFSELDHDFLTTTAVYSSLGSRGKTGLVFWYNAKTPDLKPEQEASLKNGAKKRLGALRGNVYVGYDWMPGESMGGGLYPVADLNEIRGRNGLPPLALPAICADAKLIQFLEVP